MLELPPSPLAKKTATFVPQSVMPGYTARLKRKSKKPRTKAEISMLRDDIHHNLDNLLLRHDNYIASGLPEPVRETAVRKSTATPAKKKGGGRGRPEIALVNSLRPYVKDFTFPREVLTLPGMDDIMSGAVALDLGGNTRPLNKKEMAALLQKLEVITAEAVQEQKGCSLRHAQKVAKCLGIIVVLGLRWSGSWHYPAAQEQQWAN